MSTYVAGFCHNLLSTAGPKRSRGVGVGVGVVTINARPKRSAAVVVRAEGQTINPEIRKTEEKVVDSVVVTELSKPLTAYCRLVLSFFFFYFLSKYPFYMWLNLFYKGLIIWFCVVQHVGVGGQGLSLYAMGAM